MRGCSEWFKEESLGYPVKYCFFLWTLGCHITLIPITLDYFKACVFWGGSFNSTSLCFVFPADRFQFFALVHISSNLMNRGLSDEAAQWFKVTLDHFLWIMHTHTSCRAPYTCATVSSRRLGFWGDELLCCVRAWSPQTEDKVSKWCPPAQQQQRQHLVTWRWHSSPSLTLEE